MSSVELRFEVHDALASWNAPLADWFATVIDDLARVKALSGITGLRISTSYLALWGYAGVRNSALNYAVELNARPLKKTFEDFAKNFPDFVTFRDVNYQPTLVILELDFKDPNKAMLFKLSV